MARAASTCAAPRQEAQRGAEPGQPDADHQRPLDEISAAGIAVPAVAQCLRLVGSTALHGSNQNTGESSMSSEQFSEQAKVAVIRDAVNKAVAWLGFKRGIYTASQAIGIKERVAKGAHYGEAVAAPDDRFDRAFEMRRNLARERVARLRVEIAELERLANEENIDAFRRAGLSEYGRAAY